ncbi:glycoside hydrolase family 26 [Cellulomonas flavigena DSM 20109]|uniref:Glycoside hydrolase family 26 n=1 Tax=Cellulomonas flavigena (strain ATCC 482 / DSM 20109 / BCRC 11376 / JCM 18109 / NBRC 3775 / NCIMB 8073 / NRS 134) TaxID=446466 RepID=D5ULW9_CELFN|nr:glycosyl hydrolase [Cellulomonas flavigena]ADG76075.1 glycoside hydrolase family 26 [Cellulomonas flavigena DSM 20109]
MSEHTGKHWWTLTGRLGLVGKLSAFVLALALGVVTGIVWLSPSGATPGPLKTAAEKQLEQENADLEAILRDRDEELENLRRGQEKAAAERAAGVASGTAKAEAEKAAAAERGSAKAQAEKAAAAARGKQKAAADKAAAQASAQQKAALERRLADARGDAEGAAIREAVARSQVEFARAAAAARAEAARPVRPTAPARDAIVHPTDRYFGLYTAQSPFSWAEFDEVSATVGVQPNLGGYFQGWDTPFRPDAVERSWTKGVLPMVTWESRPMEASNSQATEPEYSLPRIIGGAFDDYLRQYARDVKALGLPVAIRLNHEMNGGWYPWGELGSNGVQVNGNNRGDYVKMWRHVHDIFQAEGANEHVIWVWSPNIVNNLPQRNVSLAYTASMYPGDEYVDWVGLSGYYRPPFAADQTATFSYTFDRSLKQLRAITSKPILLAEIGASETGGGDKPAWVADLFRSLAKPENSDVIGFAWFHHTVTTISGGQRVTNDWKITSREDSQRAFVDGIHAPSAGFVRGN